jgi:hypothetical protein
MRMRSIIRTLVAVECTVTRHDWDMANRKQRAYPARAVASSSHLLEGVDGLNHLVAHIVDLVEELHVIHLLLRGGSVEVVLVANVPENRVRLANALVAVDEVPTGSTRSTERK